MANRKGAVKPGSSREEVEQRIAHLRMLIVTGEWNEKTRHKLSAKLAKQWDVSPRMIRDYAHRGRRDIDAVHHVDVNELKSLRQIAMLRAEYVFSEAVKRRSLIAAIAANEQWCKIAGVDELSRRKDAREESKERRDAERHSIEVEKLKKPETPTTGGTFEVHLSYPERPKKGDPA